MSGLCVWSNRVTCALSYPLKPPSFVRISQNKKWISIPFSLTDLCSKFLITPKNYTTKLKYFLDKTCYQVNKQVEWSLKIGISNSITLEENVNTGENDSESIMPCQVYRDFIWVCFDSSSTPQFLTLLNDRFPKLWWVHVTFWHMWHLDTGCRKLLFLDPLSNKFAILNLPSNNKWGPIPNWLYMFLPWICPLMKTWWCLLTPLKATNHCAPVLLPTM